MSAPENQVEEMQKHPQDSKEDAEVLDVRVLDLSRSCSRPGRVACLIEEAREEVTRNPAANLTNYEAELEYAFLQDRRILDSLEQYLLANYMADSTRQGNSCGCWGSIYENNSEDSPVKRLLTRIKKGNSTLAKSGQKSKGKTVVYQIGEAMPASKELKETNTYSLTDILAGRFVLKNMDDVWNLAARLWEDNNLETSDEEYKYKPNTGYEAIHMTVMYQGVAIDLHLITEKAFEKSLADGYHGKKKYDHSSLAKPSLLAQEKQKQYEEKQTDEVVER